MTPGDRLSSLSRMATLPGIYERTDATGRTRYLVRIRRVGFSFTATYATLAEAVAGRDAALNRAASEQAPAPTPPLRGSTATTVPVAFTVFSAADRLIRGMKQGSTRTKLGTPYKPSVVRKYEEALRILVLPRIGARSVADLKRGDVQRLVDDIAAALTAEHAQKALTALRVALRDCERYGELELSPCVQIRTPASHSPEREARSLTPVEAVAVIAAGEAEDEKMKRSLSGPMLRLALGTGLRLGEQLALPWGPTGLDVDAGHLRVTRSLDTVRDGTGTYPFIPPKSRRGTRTVPLPPNLTSSLRRHRLASGRPADGELVFSGRSGEPLEPKNPPRRLLARAWRDAGLGEPAPRWHDLRHTYATWQLSAGLNDYAVAQLLGDSVQMIQRRYGHALPDDVASAGARLEAFHRAHGLAAD